MKFFKPQLLLAAVLLFGISLQSCKSKKVVAKPTPPVVAPKPEPVEEKQPEPEPAPEPAPVPEKASYNFNNIQFEFNSDVLKTASFEILDQVVREMKKDLTVGFVLNGNSSAEGSVEHNLSLSVDRANSVKSYLVNAGIPAANLSIKGFGATKPITTNDSEEGRALNRRVEIKRK
ncbi:possible outer membrane protein [Pedobacter sp. BAL39]|uniref:OmpA family protein n=1 Tax=Pedobacter sp. BAL39 TaxID=391596 RepID=UPI0001559BDB|nr:OmpA family protein [Pedobacter sp. BAL39]EDM36728.1 possible outer membrane protein [Pedobacter sp. BAL39]